MVCEHLGLCRWIGADMGSHCLWVCRDRQRFWRTFLHHNAEKIQSQSALFPLGDVVQKFLSKLRMNY